MSKQGKRKVSCTASSITFRRRVQRMARRLARAATRTEAMNFTGAEPGVPRGTGKLPTSSGEPEGRAFDIDHSELYTWQDLLDEYGRGYAAGKDKAHFEIRNISDHSRGCGCEPCITARFVVARYRGLLGAEQ